MIRYMRFVPVYYSPLRDEALKKAYGRAGIERISGIPSLHEKCLAWMDDDCEVPVRFALDLKANKKAKARPKP